MPRPRKPRDLALILGADIHDPQRYRKRTAAGLGQPVGDPPEHLTAAQACAWNTMRREIPWLDYSHRTLLGMASILAARHAGGALCDSGANLLRLCLGMMGATPVDARKVR
jgi:hypothetical protein